MKSVGGSVGVRGNTHGRNEICAQTSSRRNVNPIFPGITSGPRGERWGRARGVGEMVTRGRARALLDKRSFFHFSWRRQVSASLSNITLLLLLLAPRLPARLPPSSLSLFRCERALFMQSSVYFRENRPRGEEERRTRSGQEEGKKRVAAGCGDLFLASYRSRSLAWSVDRTGADASQVPQKGWFFLLSFFFSPFSSSRERLSATALLRQITHRGFLNFPLF